MYSIIFAFYLSCSVAEPPTTSEQPNIINEQKVVIEKPKKKSKFNPEKEYKIKCQSCHGADGKGNGWAANFAETDVLKKDDKALSQSITKGKNSMPSFGWAYNEKEIAEIIKYLRQKYQ
jgi:cytochrome c5